MAKQQTMSFEEYRKEVAHDYMWSEMLGSEQLDNWAFIMCDKMTDIIRKYYDAGIPWDEVEDRLWYDEMDDCWDQIIPMVKARIEKEVAAGNNDYGTVKEYEEWAQKKLAWFEKEQAKKKEKAKKSS